MILLYGIGGLLALVLVVLLTGQLTIDLVFAVFLTAIVFMYLLQFVVKKPHAIWAGLWLLLYFLYDLWQSIFKLTKDIMAIHPRFHPAIIAIDTRTMSAFVKVGFAVIVSIIPGTLAISFGKKGRSLYVYSLYARNRDQAKADMLKHAANLRRVVET